jgi:DNA-binding beta-propeller fold protein YncE
MKSKLPFLLLFFTILSFSQNIVTLGLGYHFTSAVDIARDIDGNLYACDNVENSIIKIDLNNKTTVISAGNGKPSAIAIDNVNNLLYVAYESPGTNGGKVFKMNLDGTNSQLFSNPNVAIVKMNVFGIYLWFTASGNNNHLGRIALSDGTVGYTNTLPTSIQASCDFTFDSSGNSYYVFANSSNILKIDSIFSSFTTINADTNRLSIDYCSSGNFLITSGVGDIKIIGTDGLLIGSYFNPMSPTGGLMFPMCVVGKVYQTIDILYQSGSDGFYLLDFKYPDQIYTYRGSKFNSPKGLTLDNANNAYFTSNDPSTSYNQVNKISLNTLNNINVEHLYSSTNTLEGVSFNNSNNLICFADKTANSIKSVNTTGTVSGDYVTGLNNPYLYKNTSNSTDFYTQRNYSYIIKRTVAGFPPQTNYSYLGVLTDPKGFDFDNSGNVYVADYGTNFIQKINIASGTSNNLGEIGNNFNKPSAVAVDTQHNLIYVADTDNNAVKRMDFNGNNIIIVSNVFNKPEGICLDATKTKLYVADTGNNVIKIVDLTALLSVSSFNNDFNFKIYPNPTSDFIQIKSNENVEIKNIKIYDSNGRIVAKYSNNSENKYDISQLENGIYLCEINSNLGSENYKIIKK